MPRDVSLREIFGLTPLGPAIRQCAAAVLGDRYAPPSQWDTTSLAILRPKVAFPLWRGRVSPPRRAQVYLLPNRVERPRHEGYSVRVTTARDFRGRAMSYDGHVGTDFAVPPGTRVTAAASGVVFDVRNDMQRGGLKVCIDHGGGLITTSNHLARALVDPGDEVSQGATVGLSGMSGVDGILFSPWLAPHLHFNVLLDGVPTDPWAAEGETSLWNEHNAPTPSRDDDHAPPTGWSREAMERCTGSCRDPEMRHQLESLPIAARGRALAIWQLLFAHRFEHHEPLCIPRAQRSPRLALPFSGEDFDGVVFCDEL